MGLRKTLASNASFARSARRFEDVMGAGREAYILGDGTGRWDDPDDSSKFLARKDDNAPVESFSLGSNALLDPWDGCPVMVGWEDGERCIVAMSRTGLKAQGINPKRYNPADTRLHGWGSKEGLPDWSVQAIGTLANPSTKFVVQPNAFYDDEYQFQASLRIQGDAASYIPGAGVHRLLMVAVKPDLTLHYSPSTTQSIATDFDTSDFQECLAALYPRATPVIFWRLADDADRLTDADKFMDGRMIFNIMPPRMNWSATTDPDENDDETKGYGLLSGWINTTAETAWVCVKADEGDALWLNLGGSAITLTSPDGTIEIGGSPGSALTVDVADGAIGLSQLEDGTPNTVLGFDGSGDPTTILVDNDGTLAANSATRLPTQQAVKSYVDAVAQGLAVKYAVIAATTAPLPANTYANGSSGVGATLTGTSTGTLTIDGQLIALNDRVLVKDEAAPANNGIYVCTTAGALGVAYVLTRATDMNQPSEIPGAFTFTANGTVNDGIGFVVADPGPFTIGTTAINWTQFSGAGQIIAGDGLDKTGNTLNVDNTVIRTSGAQSIGTGLSIDTPTVANLSNMQHDHLDADDGGTLTPAIFGTQTANTVLAGPTTGSAANPTFRALVQADLPLLNVGAETQLTITSNAVTITGTRHRINTGGTDALVNTMSGGADGKVVVIRMAGGGTLTFDPSATIQTLTGDNLTIYSSLDHLIFVCEGTLWKQVTPAMLGFKDPDGDYDKYDGLTIPRTLLNTQWGSTTPRLEALPNMSTRRFFGVHASRNVLQPIGMAAPTMRLGITESVDTDSAWVNTAIPATLGTDGGYDTTFDLLMAEHYPDQTIYFKTGPGANDVSNCRIWIGAFSAGPTNVDDLAGATKGWGFFFSTVLGHTTWHGFVDDGTTFTTVNTGVALAINTPYLLRVLYRSNFLYFRANNGSLVSIGTPSMAGTKMGLSQAFYTTTNQAKAFKMGRHFVEAN